MIRDVKLLLDYFDIKMINLNAQDLSGSSGFMEACRLGLHLNVECLIKHSAEAGIDLNATNDDWMTGFMLACKRGHGLVVEVILQYSRMFKIDLHANDKQGRTGFDLWPKNLPFIGHPRYPGKRLLLCNQFDIE